MVAHIMHDWEALTAESNRMGGHQRNLINHQQGKGVEDSRRGGGQFRDFQCYDGEELPGLQ